MKINKIIKLCKSESKILIFNDKTRGIQWLSNGFSVYPLIEFPTFDGMSFCTTYGLDESKFELNIYEELPKTYDFSDSNNLETEVIKLDFFVCQKPCDVIAFQTEYGIEFFDAACFAPFGDYGESDLQYFIRFAGKTPYLVVKNGFMLIGMILPKKVIDRQFVERLQDFKTKIDMTFYNKSEELENG